MKLVTIAELKKIKTFGQLVDRMEEKLLKQGCPSVNPGNICYYRGNNNTACAVGWIVPDSMYSVDLEGGSVTLDSYYKNNITNFMMTYWDFTEEQLRLLYKIQRVHDETAENHYSTDLPFNEAVQKGFAEIRQSYSEMLSSKVSFSSKRG